MNKRTFNIWIFICLMTLLTVCQSDTSHIHQLNQNFIRHEKVSNLRTHDYYSSSNNSMGGAVFCFILSPICFILSFIMIWFNQKRAVIDHRRLKLAQEICIDVNPLRRDQITSANSKLTHTSGKSNTTQVLLDTKSGVSSSGALKINRSVQVMEWRATTRESNGTRHTQYHLGWQTSNMENAQGRNNPLSNWFINSQTIYNQKLYVGQYNLLKSQIDLCHKSTPITPDMTNARQIVLSSNRTNQSAPTLQDNYIYFASGQSISDHGSLRVKFSFCPVGPISIVAKTVNNTFVAFPIAQYQGNGVVQKNQLPAFCCLSSCVAQMLKPIETIQLVEEEMFTKDQLIDKAISNARLFTNIIRLVSFALMVFSICMFFSPISTILGYIPLIGGLFKSLVGFVIFLAALLVSIPLFIIAFSCAWCFYHPKIGIAILVVGLSIIGILIFLSSRAQKATTPQEAAKVAQHLVRSWTTFHQII